MGVRHMIAKDKSPLSPCLRTIFHRDVRLGITCLPPTEKPYSRNLGDLTDCTDDVTVPDCEIGKVFGNVPLAAVQVLFGIKVPPGCVSVADDRIR